MFDCWLYRVAFTILSMTFWPVLMDIGNLIHAKEHGIIWTSLPIGFTACKMKLNK